MVFIHSTTGNTMVSTISIRDQIAQTQRLDYSHLAIHHKFKKHMDAAPVLKPYDFAGLLRVIRSWFDDNLFKYSMLDIWLENSTKFVYAQNELRIEGTNNLFNLKYNSGVCCHLAFKCKHMIDILYPWASVIAIEKLDWRGNGGNHFFLLIPELGITEDGTYIEPNLNFGDLKRFQNSIGNLKLQGLVHCIDPTRSYIGRHLENTLYQSPIHSQLNCHINFSQKTSVMEMPEDDSFHYWLAHRFDNEEFGTLCFGVTKDKHHIQQPFWSINQKSYEFDSPLLVDKVGEYDKVAAIKIAIIQRRGFVVQ